MTSRGTTADYTAEKAGRAVHETSSGQKAFDIVRALGNNSPLFLRGSFMAASPPVFTVLLLTADTDVQAQFKQALKDTAITIARDAAAFHRETSKHQFDAAIIESRGGSEKSFTLPAHVDPSRTLIIIGSRAVLKKTAKTIHLVNHTTSHPTPHHDKGKDSSLESYLEMKMGDFVRGMRIGSAKNLHPILISAIERPLIASVLQETQGNQIQAANLLGLNRNTLRKKIADLHIPVKRAKDKSKPAA